jgi:hypothetical protein
MERKVPASSIEYAQKRLGVDVAFEGDDSTVLFPRQGLVSYQPVEMRNAKPSEISSRIVYSKNKWNSELEFVDNTGGFGSGVVDNLQQAGFAPIPIHFAGSPDDPRYLNKRAENYFRMAEWVKNGGCLPPHARLLKELVAPRYTHVRGKFQIEPKEHIKKRLGFSPDFADALSLTFSMPDMPAQNHPINFTQNKNQCQNMDFNPFRDL